MFVREGFATAGFAASIVLDESSGIGQGFEAYDGGCVLGRTIVAHHVVEGGEPMKIRLMTACALAVLAIACGEDNPVRPTPGSSSSVHYIAGAVSEPVGVVVEGYTLRAVDGEKSQEIRVEGSEYRVLVQEGPVTIEVTKDGYQTGTVSLDVHAFTRHDLEIAPVTQPAAYTGPFWMTLSADPAACGSLPADLRTRRYAVDVGQAGAAVTIDFSDPRLTGEKAYGQVHGNALSFDLSGPDWYYGTGGYTLEEKLDDARRLVIVGPATASVRDGEAVGQLSGNWTLQVDKQDAQSCNGAHEVRFARR